MARLGAYLVAIAFVFQTFFVNVSSELEYSKVMAKIEELERKDAQKTLTIAKLQDSLETQTKDNVLQSRMIAELNRKVVMCNVNAGPQEATVDTNVSTRSANKRLSENTRRQRFVVDVEQPVAFHAVVDKQEIQHITVGQPIVFETVLLNSGGAYHNSHGLFIAPMHGIYMFSASILSDYVPKVHIESAIVKNGAILTRIHAYSADGMRDQGSATIMTELQTGEEVWVQQTFPDDDALFGNRWTSFSGALIAMM